MIASGCRVGDFVVIIGDLGLFWTGVLALRYGTRLDAGEKDELLRNVLTPVPKVLIGEELAMGQLLQCCIDNSDGLYPSLSQLADMNSCNMYVNFEGVSFPPAVLRISSELGVDPIRPALGWGDWQLVGCVDPLKLGQVERIANKYGVPMHVVGSVRAGRGVSLEHRGRVGEMAPLDSQRFTEESWFTKGLESYIDMLVRGPLWRD